MDEKKDVLTLTYDLLHYLVPQLIKFPRHQKFVLADPRVLGAKCPNRCAAARKRLLNFESLVNVFGLAERDIK